MSFRFIDLFAGIGGMRLAGEAAGGTCVFSSEIDPKARRTYAANFCEEPSGDITRIASEDVPAHEAILAGFPCQPFSKSGSLGGFEDARGTLFFEVARIARDHRTPALILENVRNLAHHDGGRTLRVILGVLRDLGYSTSWRLLNANRFGLAQSRERIVVVARRGEAFSFPDADSRPISACIRDVLGPDPDTGFLAPGAWTEVPPELVKRQPRSGIVFCGYIPGNPRWFPTSSGPDNLSRVHKQQNRIHDSSGTQPTISAQETGGRYWVRHEGRVRKLTVAECYRLQGFPEGFVRTGSPADQLRQIGNSVPVPMISEIACLALAGHAAPAELPLAA